VPILVLGAIALLVLAVLIVGGLYYATALKNGALVIERTAPEPDLEVAAVEEGRVTLRVTAKTRAGSPWTEPGIWGLERENGYDQVGAILEMDDRQVVREYIPITGGLRIGEIVRLDSFAFSGDPLTAHGLPYREVSFTSSLGEFPAWLVEGRRDTWVLFVHGKGAGRREALRILPILSELGFPCLVITYRNDAGVPQDPSGFYRYGETEWAELHGAADFARRQGAIDLILVGYSMGGGIVTSFLLGSRLAKHVTGVILDAPLLDFRAAIDFGARRRSAPWPLPAIGKVAASFRYGIDWGRWDYLRRAAELTVPVLLFHGAGDGSVPVESSDALAEARSDIVTYVRSLSATHVRSWNVDLDGYAAAVASFLGRVALGPD
jgi:pimeloyl-ACP methyl ester carboxylesterase